jgi:hypothetical protein
LSKAICQTLIHNWWYFFFIWKSLFGHKMDEFKFNRLADIPAYFIVIKIHVRIKIFYLFGLKSWNIGFLLNPIFG